MGLVTPPNELTNDASILRDYFLDVRLLIYSIDTNESKDFGGLATYTVEAFRENIGFGITNIQIETNASLQPVVEITFRDLYGNSVFSKNLGGNSIGMYKELFDLPPPKFDLSFKGYLGKTTKMKLNLKKTDIQYDSHDGSFTIKCSFLPNLWGPFADIPIGFLYAVKGLKQKENIPNIVTFFDLIKIGKQVEVRTKNIGNSYDSLKKKIQGTDSLVSSIINKDITPGEEIKGIASNKNGVIFGFNNIKVYDVKSEKNEKINSIEKLSSNSENITTLNNYWLLKSDVGGASDAGGKLNSLTYDEYSSVMSTTATGSIATTTSGLDSKIFADLLNERRIIIGKDLSLIDDEISAESFVQNKTQLSQIVISDIFSKLGGDTGYIIGNILKAGLQGYAGAKDARDGATDIIGKYYPLKINDNDSNNGNFQNSQSPVPLTGTSNGQVLFNTTDKSLTNEWDFVNKFTEAISAGLGDVAEIAQEFDSKGRNKLIKRINNLESLQGNPYESNFQSVVSNLIVRSGIWSHLTRNLDPNTPGSYSSSFVSFNDNATTAAGNELENITNATLEGMSADDLLKLRNTCIYFENAIEDGNSSYSFDSTKKITISSGTTPLSYNYADAVGTAMDSLIRAGIPNGIDATKSLVNNQLFWIVDFGLIPNTYSTSLTFTNWSKFHSSKAGSSYYNMLVFNSKQDIEELKTLNSSDTDTKFRADPESQDKPGILKPYEPPGYSTIDNFIEKSKQPGHGRQASFNHWLNDNAMFNYKFFTDAYSQFTSVPPSPNNVNALNQVNSLTNTALWTNGEITKDSTPFLPLTYCCWSAPEELLCWDLFGTTSRAKNQRIFLRAAFSKLKLNIDTLSNEKTIKIGNVAAQAQKMSDLIYNQFHHIFYQWYSLVYNEETETTLNNDYNKKKIDVFETNKLPSLIEAIYSASSVETNCTQSGGYSKGFQYIAPLIRNSQGGAIDVENSIINLESCYHIDANTTVLNVIQNICTKNNFLFFPIAGGDPYNLDSLFTPELVSTDINYGNRFVVLWSPTPESRVVNNKGTDLAFIQKKDEIKVCAFEVQIGSTDNALFKNLNVSTDSTKTTAESIFNLQRLVDKQVENKQVTKDCSTIPVIEGRSFTCEVETLGNAQISPLQYFYLDKIPIFGGLYQIMGTKHTITPNNMVTTFKGMKMRYNAGKYGGTPPVTLKSLEELSQKLNIISNTGEPATSSKNSVTATEFYQPYPGGPSFKGIDVSTYQTNINWSNVKGSGIDFVYIKSSEGMGLGRQSIANKRASDASDAGLLIGYYHFALPSKHSAIDEANYFDYILKRLPKYDLVPALDFEDDAFKNSPNSVKVKWAEDFILQMKKLGRETMLYVGAYYFDPSQSKIITNSKLWLAQYYNGQQPKALPNGFKNFTVWQNTDKGQVNGIPGNVDSSIAYYLPKPGLNA